MNKVKKSLYVVGGLISLAMGLIGIVLPVFPTTPFLLLASFCFAKGSDRFDRWFKGTELYKNHLESFVRERTMSMKTKIKIIVFADIMILFPWIMVDSLVVKGFLICVIAYKYYYFMYRIKTI